MQEMAVAWKMTVDMRLGLFAVSHDESCSVPGSHALDYQPSVINITPHHLWTRVSVTAGALLAIKPEACAMVIIARWSLENKVNVCWGLSAGYQPRPQVVDRGTTARYGGQLRYI